jgi:hypothetical protein
MVVNMIIHNSKLLVKMIVIKISIILITVFIYSIAFAANTNVSNQYVLPANTSPGVCVFDIDFTLSCAGAYAAVMACREAGFDLAINTARNKRDAYQIVVDGTLIKKGFDPYFVEIARNQQGLNGPFQYSESWAWEQPREQQFQNKSYAMRNIAKYYNFKTDDIESRKLVLFDDMLHNIVQMQPNILEPYYKSRCKYDNSGLCYRDPNASPDNVAYPRNWKIYRSKWIGHFCLRWDNPKTAREDAIEMINEVLFSNNRQLINNDGLSNEYLVD